MKTAFVLAVGGALLACGTLGACSTSSAPCGHDTPDLAQVAQPGGDLATPPDESVSPDLSIVLDLAPAPPDLWTDGATTRPPDLKVWPPPVCTGGYAVYYQCPKFGCWACAGNLSPLAVPCIGDVGNGNKGYCVGGAAAGRPPISVCDDCPN